MGSLTTKTQKLEHTTLNCLVFVGVFNELTAFHTRSLAMFPGKFSGGEGELFTGPGERR
jgi:hypothetical protein